MSETLLAEDWVEGYAVQYILRLVELALDDDGRERLGHLLLEPKRAD